MEQKTYRQKEIERVTRELEIASTALSMAVGDNSTRCANESIEFWSNKLAFLENLHYGAFQDENSTEVTK